MKRKFYLSPEPGNTDPSASNQETNIAPVEINLDALSVAEGADSSLNNREGETFKDLPNLDPVPGYQPDNIINTDNQQQNSQQSSNEYYMKPFEALKARLGEDFEIPNDITADNYFDKLLEIVYDNTEFPETQNGDLHPELQRLDQAIKAGVPFEKAIQQYNQNISLENLEPKELVKQVLTQRWGKSERRPNGWDEAKIASTVDNMERSGVLDVEAERIKEEIAYERQNLSQKMANEENQRRQSELTEIGKAREEQVNQSIQYLNSLNEISGIPVSKAEIQEFTNDFRYLVTPDESGVAPGIKLLQSNENLVKALFLLKKGDTKIREALTNAKEGVKNQFFDKLDPEPRNVKKNSQQDAGVIDLDALAAPEGYNRS